MTLLKQNDLAVKSLRLQLSSSIANQSSTLNGLAHQPWAIPAKMSI
jgi:hypothetical protein